MFSIVKFSLQLPGINFFSNIKKKVNQHQQSRPGENKLES